MGQIYYLELRGKMGDFKEYQVVNAKRTINNKVIKGVQGTILIVYDTIPPQYEVEFVDLEGDTLDLITVSECDLCS